MSDARFDTLLFGTTSYVLPADLLPNVRLLAPFVDDIELILFEGEASNLPSRADVRDIGLMGGDSACGFTVHLPLDVGIGENDRDLRHRAQETCLRVVDLTLGLEPHAFVVHPELPLRYHPAFGEKPEPLHELPTKVHEAWQEALGESLARLRRETGEFPLAVENLQFPYEWVDDLLDAHDLGVTLDVGHLLMHGGDVEEHLERFGRRLSVVHLHGIVDGVDHREIGAFPQEELERILDGVAAARTERPVAGRRSPGRVAVSMEVFGWKPTVSSLRTLADLLGEGRGDSFREAADAVVAELPRWKTGEA